MSPQNQTESLARLIGQTIGECPCAVLPVLGEVLAAAAVIIRSRKRNPTPPRMVVNSDLSEEVAR
jgi:hypothetical protein